jgi:hypothetical protein
MDKAKMKESRHSMFLEVGEYVKKKFRTHFSKSTFKKLYGSSIYSPHQGEQEKARRRNQIARGIIQVSK